jgi:predicted MFS family arabinose efflux permease
MIGLLPEIAMPPTPTRPYIRLVWSNLAAQSAEQLSLAAAPIVAVLALGAGAGEIGLLAAAQTLPFLLLSIPLGLLADRTSRKRLMIWAEALRALSLFGLLAAVLLDRLSLELLAALGFIGAVGTVGFSVAAPALLPSLVPREDLARANGRIELARSAAFAAGPALAGALVSWAGASSAFVLASMLSAGAVALLFRLPDPQRAPAPPRHPLLELQDGARMVWGHALLRPMLLTGIAWNIAWFVLQAAYVPYAVRTLGLDAGEVGITLAAYGVGMVLGALLARRIVGAITFGHAIILGPFVSVLAAAVMATSLLLPTGVLAALSFFLFGFGPIIWSITSTTLRQTVTPGAMLGRAGSIFLTVNSGVRPIGAALGGWVGSSWGEAACLWLVLVIYLVQAAVIFFSPVRALAALPEPAP